VGVLGPDQRHALERLVREVQGVALVDEDVVRHGGEHDPLGGREVAGLHDRGQRPLGRVR